MKFVFVFLSLFFPVLMPGADLGNVVLPLKEPTVVQAKKVLGDLATLIAEGDARTVTLGKKMERSIRRIFTAEHKVLEEKKRAEEKEAKAKQLILNGRKWLKPNVHGRINKVGAQAAFEEARTIRLQTKWRQEEVSKQWGTEVADFEKMLGDLEFSKEDKALVTLAGVLATIVQRTGWVERPLLKFSAERLAFLKERMANKERWLLLGRASEDAGDFELAYDFYRQAGDEKGRKRTGAQFAEKLLLDGFPGSALNYLDRIGEVEKAAALRQKYPEVPAESYRPLAPAALKRNVAPACVRVLTPNGFQSGFFVKAGGYLLTCKYGLRKGEDEPLKLAVLLEDGQQFVPKIVRESASSDVALLRIECGPHELIPLGNPKELTTGSKLSLFGFSAMVRNKPDVNEGTVLRLREGWRGQIVNRLAMDGSPGNRGAPLVNTRGKVLGLYLSSKTGATFALEAGELRTFLK